MQKDDDDTYEIVTVVAWSASQSAGGKEAAGAIWLGADRGRSVTQSGAVAAARLVRQAAGGQVIYMRTPPPRLKNQRMCFLSRLFAAGKVRVWNGRFGQKVRRLLRGLCRDTLGNPLVLTVGTLQKTRRQLSLSSRLPPETASMLSRSRRESGCFFFYCTATDWLLHWLSARGKKLINRLSSLRNTTDCALCAAARFFVGGGRFFLMILWHWAKKKRREPFLTPVKHRFQLKYDECRLSRC